MDWIINIVKAEWEVITTAPFSVLIITLVLLFLAWKINNWYFRKQLNDKDATIVLLETRLKTVAKEETKQFRRGELDLKGQWFENRFVLDEPLLIVSDSTMTSMTPEIGTVACPPNSLVHIRYELQDNMGGLARLAIRRVGSTEEPTLHNSGGVEVLVNEESQFEYVVDKVIRSDVIEINVTVWLLGWTENLNHSRDSTTQQFVHRPDMLCNPRLHRRRHSQATMNSAEVVPRKVQG